TLRGHTDYVASVAYSPDGRALATSSADGTIKLWSPVGGKELRTLREHGGAVFSVAFSPSGRCLASATGDRTVKIWDATSDQEARVLGPPFLHRHCAALAFRPDGREIAVADLDRTTLRSPGYVHLLDVTTEQVALRLGPHPGAFKTVAFSPDGSLVAADWDTAVRLWDARTGREVDTLRGHTGSVTALAFSPSG